MSKLVLIIFIFLSTTALTFSNGSNNYNASWLGDRMDNYIQEYDQGKQDKVRYDNNGSCGVRPTLPSYCYGYGDYYCECNGYNQCSWRLVGCNK